MSETLNAPESPGNNDDEYLRQQFRLERRNRVIFGVLVLVLGAAAALGILYYFATMSAMP